AAQALGGHATCFTPGITDNPFHPLPPALLNVHRQLKRQLDPHGIFNPGRLYATV
ncbi:MAG: FAD-linked oxidase C-terminal domain-containing protein, partial [Trinickia sp.]